MSALGFKRWALIGMAGAALVTQLACLPFRSERVPDPEEARDICALFERRPEWRRSVEQAQERWGTPAPITMAFIYQESAFVSTARPPKRKLFGILPWGRPSSAYGYSQALDSTWQRYQEETGNRRHRRDRFADAVNFIGWYNDLSDRECGISKRNAREMYLAYHEGQGGYKRGTHRAKRWLLDVADRVAERATRYRGQLASCAAVKEPGFVDRLLEILR